MALLRISLQTCITDSAVLCFNWVCVISGADNDDSDGLLSFISSYLHNAGANVNQWTTRAAEPSHGPPPAYRGQSTFIYSYLSAGIEIKHDT